MHSLFCSILIAILTLLTALASIITWPLSPSGAFIQVLAKCWAKLILKACGVHVCIKGAENIDPEKTYLFMSNHLSHFDGLCLFKALPRPVWMIAKSSLKYVPVMGLAMQVGGFIFIDRKNPKKAFKSINRAVAKVKKGRSVLLFPEGTRGRTGELQKFKKGGFILAMNAGVDILPIAIRGTERILPKKTLKFSKGIVHLTFGRPIPTKDFAYEQREELISLVWQQMNRLLQDAGAAD